MVLTDVEALTGIRAGWSVPFGPHRRGISPHGSRAAEKEWDMGAGNGTSGAVQAEAARRRQYRDLDDDETPSENTRETDHYKAQYVMGFVNKWDELIDWDSAPRAKASSSSTN